MLFVILSIENSHLKIIHTLLLGNKCHGIFAGRKADTDEAARNSGCNPKMHFQEGGFCGTNHKAKKNVSERKYAFSPRPKAANFIPSNAGLGMGYPTSPSHPTSPINPGMGFLHPKLGLVGFVGLLMVKSPKVDFFKI